ncbi:MAG: hypothetical protein QM483_11470 [Desulfuromusa sp.]
MKKIMILVIIVAFFLISGCETFHGLGKDVENAGTWLQQKSD